MESDKNDLENLKRMNRKDQVKFVIGTRADYEYAVEIIRLIPSGFPGYHILFSPVFGKIKPSKIAEWILEDKLDVRFHLQLHNLMTTDKKSVVLSSGGLDSTTVMAIAKNEGYALYSLSFLYGQRHKIELEAAKKVAEIIGVEKHLVINLDLNKIGGSALTDSIDVPKNRNEEAISADIPVTYVPARNTIFLSYALAWIIRYFYRC